MNTWHLGWVCLALVNTDVLAEQPPWWTATQTRIIDPNASHQTEANYAPANVGQLKNVSGAAWLHVKPLLPEPGYNALIDSARIAIEAQISAWTERPSAENYAPANIGQLKNVAKDFYVILKEIGYLGPPANRDSATNFPWTTTTADDSNYSPLNVGQLKNVFSFDLSIDSDQDGLSDLWERRVSASLTLLSGVGGHDTDADGVSDLQEFQNGTNPSDPAPRITLLSPVGTATP